MSAGCRCAARLAVYATAACGCGPAEHGGVHDGGTHDGGTHDGGTHDGGAHDGGAERVPAPTFEPVFSAIYREIFATESCTLGLCHGEGSRGGGLDLHPAADAYSALVDVQSTGALCSGLGLALVEPGDPASSLLLLKLRPAPPCGALMPPDWPLTSAQLEQVETWIALGAHDD